MRKVTKIWLIVSLALVGFGGLVFTVVMSALGWDFKRLNTVEYEKNSYEITEEFHGILVTADTADVRLVLANDGGCRVVCNESEQEKHAVSVVDGVLKIEALRARAWTDYIGVGLGETSVTVYLPKAEYASVSLQATTADITVDKEFTFTALEIAVTTGDVECFASAQTLKITTSTGDISVENASVGSVDLSVTSGETELKNLTCESLFSKGNTGDIELENVVVSGKLEIVRTTGDVEFERVDGGEIVVKTSTGDISGTVLTQKEFIAKSNTGKVRVPKTTGGRCELTTDTGDLEVSIAF